MTSNIPSELKALQQWVCFDTVDGQKLPFIPGTDDNAASNRSRDWRSYRAALADVESGKRQYLGFCFSSTDPYVFIDLDDSDDADQWEVFNRIDTYAQRSVSGKGCHLICKGTFQGSGKHPKAPAAGIFKENRFCLMTGDVVKGREEIKEVDEDVLQAVHTWLGGNGSEAHENGPLVEYHPEIPDMTVYEMGCARFLKFKDLCNGKWEKYPEFHGDHSTADHAFIAMLCDLTESNEQVRWFFGTSGMWNKARAAKKAGHGFEGYVNRTISKIRGSQARDAAKAAKVQINFEDDEDEAPEEKAVPAPAGSGAKGARNLIDDMPPGLLRDLVEYSFATAYLPLQEVSVMGPLNLLSALTGRGYVTPTNSGLNLWTVVVGRTGCGKDELQKSVKRILSGVSKQVPHIRRVFGGELVSGPAIETTFQDTLRYIAYFKEFGKTFATLANPHAQEHTRSLVGGLLNSYNAADIGGSLEGRKKAKNEGEKPFIERPCLCLLGDSTPSELYDSVSTRELASGFLQRFMILDVDAASWSMNANPNSGAPLPRPLAEKLTMLVEMMERFDADPKNKPLRVPATPSAMRKLEAYALNKRQAIRHSTGASLADEVYNRAGLKVLRLATISAVSGDFHKPLIEDIHVDWAIRFVEHLDALMLAKFATGEVGSGQVKQEAEILKAAHGLQEKSTKARMKLGMSKLVALNKEYLPLSCLKQVVIHSPSFEQDKYGAVTAFEKCVSSMIKAGVFSHVDATFASETLEHTNKGTLLCVES